MNKLVFVTGGAASGKSEHAERILCENAAGAKLYLATMEPYGEEALNRIERHRKFREGKGFDTVECYTGLSSLELQKRFDGILLEDVGNLFANEMFRGTGEIEEAVQSVLNGIRHLRRSCDVLVVVTNEVFSDGADYPRETLGYIEGLGKINAAIAGEAAEAYESVVGIAVKLGVGCLS